MSALQSLGPEIWIAEGPVVSFFGFPYPTRMAVIRLADGRLFVWSPIALTPELKGEIDALGPPAHLISPNFIHHLWLGDWKKAYPAARMFASPGLARRRRDLAFDARLGDEPDPAWAADIDQVAVHGNLAMTETVFLHRLSRTAIFADLIENFSPDWFPGWKGVVASLDGIVHPDFGAPRELRLAFVQRRRAREAIRRVIAFDPVRVVIAHGMIAQTGGTDFVRSAFRWLVKD
jgi:hypothetical protein